MSTKPFEFNNNLNLQSAYIATHVTSEHRSTTQEFANNLSLRVLLRGLREPLGPLLRTRNPKSLGEALNMMTNDYQIEPPKTHPRPNYTNKNNNQFPAISSNKSQYPGNFKQQLGTFRPNPNTYLPTQNRLNVNNYIPPQMRSNNFNSQNNLSGQGTSRNNFNGQGTSRNNFYGQGTPQNKLPLPTPMSVSTRNTNRSFNRPNLYNIEDAEIGFEGLEQGHEDFPEADFDENFDDGNFPITASEESN